MRDSVRQAVLDCVHYAVHKNTQSGRHIVPLQTTLIADMVRCGYEAESVCSDSGNVTLPGWFRPSKKWDITAFYGETLVAAIELKSINSSFGNNANNRAEEALGSAVDVDYATKNHLLEPNSLPPSYGYVLVIRKTDESSQPRKGASLGRYEQDQAFDGASYIDRFVLLGKRLLRERIYQAVWVVVVDLENETVEEPDPQMTYDKFIAHLKSWIDIMKA